MKPLSYSAKAYIALTTLLGLVILMHALPQWQPNQLVRYGCYLAGAVLTSQM